ncbi:MAG: glycosyltransferase family 39 protein [Chloroflexota bacterium]
MTLSATSASTESRSDSQAALSYETLAYLVIILLAIGIRWIGLGAAPLSRAEAPQALAAWRLLNPDSPLSGTISSPLTFLGELLSLSLASNSNAAARLTSMIAGIGLVIAPLVFRQRFGKLNTLVASLFLALSPIAVGTSRQSGGVGLSILGVIAALSLLGVYLRTRQQRPALLCGAALGLALAADFAAPLILLALLVGALFAWFTDDEEQLSPESLNDTINSFPWLTFGAGLVGAILTVSTVFFLDPRGLGAAADLLGRFAAGITERPGEAAYAGLALSVYEPILVLFGLYGAWLASQSDQPWKRFMAGWGVVAVLFTFIYPGALPGHALWSVVPLAVLAAFTVEALLEAGSDAPRWQTAALVAVTIALLSMCFASLIRYIRVPKYYLVPLTTEPGGASFSIPVDLVFVVIWAILLVTTWLTAASMWGAKVTLRGIGLSLLAVGLTLSIGQSAALAFSRSTSPFEPLHTDPAQPTLDSLVQTAEQISELVTGTPHNAAITLQVDRQGAVAWAFREFPNSTLVDYTDPTVDSVLVVTPFEDADPALGSNYVGQDFVVESGWRPGQLSAAQIISWLIYRTADTPANETRVILWVRNDVYMLIPNEGE